MRPRLTTIRITSSAARAPHILALAAQLNISVASALGHWVQLCLWVAEHRPAGDLDAVDLDALNFAVAVGWPLDDIERFRLALWATCITKDGALADWKDIGQPARRMAKDRSLAELKDDLRKGDPRNFPYRDAWKEAYGGELPVYRNDRDLRKLEKEYGEAEVLRRFKVMLTRNAPQFAGAHLLVKGWATFEGAGQDGMTKRRRAASAFYDILTKHGILSMAGAMERITKLQEAGTIKSAERFVALLRRCDRELLKNARTPAFAVAHIEERLGDALDA